MRTRAKSNLRQYERDYPYKITIPPRPRGLGTALGDMHKWCRLYGGDFEMFGSRFYFKTEDAAKAFAKRWHKYGP